VRQCAVLALVNVGAPRHVPQLIAIFDRTDVLQVNLLDMVGALVDETQIATLLPFILRENAMLSATYYHFREFKSREALVEVVRYLIVDANEVNVIRAETYLDPILDLIPRFFDVEIAALCADLLERIELKHIYSDPSGLVPKLLRRVKEADRDGQITRIFFERVLGGLGPTESRSTGLTRYLWHS
jgi:hypothetical protein